MDLNQSASDSAIRVYGPKVPSPNTPYPQILLYAPDLASSTPSSNGSSTEAEETLLQTYKVYTERTYEDGRTPQVLWPLAQPPTRECHGSGLHENVLSRCHSECRIICLLPETVWGLIKQICTTEARKEIQTTPVVATGGSGEAMLETVNLVMEQLRSLCDSHLWSHVAELRASKSSSTITLFVENREWPLEDFVRGMKVLAVQEEAKDPTAGEWIKVTALWKLVLSDSNDQREEDEGLRSQQDEGTAATSRPRARTVPEPPVGENYTWVTTRKQSQLGFHSLKEAKTTPRTMPKVNIEDLFTPRSEVNRASGRF